MALVNSPICNEWPSKENNFWGPQIQKIFSTAHYVCLHLRSPGKGHFLYLGRGQVYKGTCLGKKIPPSELRIKDKFLEYLRKHLRNMRLIDLYLDDTDMIDLIHYGNQKNQAWLGFFWKGPRCYFLHQFWHEKKKQFVTVYSWKENQFDDYLWEKENILAQFDELGRRDDGAKIERPYLENDTHIEQYLNSELEKLEKKSFPKKKKKFLDNKIKKIENDIKRIQLWRQLQGEIKSMNLEDKDELSWNGHKIKFKYKENSYQKQGQLYELVKKWRKGETIQQRRLLECIQERKKWENGEAYKSVRPRPIYIPFWDTKKGQNDNSMGSGFKVETFQFESWTLKVGKDAKSNDFLRNNWAHKEDYWFHIEGDTSAHVIIKSSSKSIELNDQLFIVIASALKEFSKKSYLDIPIVYSQVKGLRGVKGAPGSVTIKRPRYRNVAYDQDWRKLLSME